MKLKTYLKKIPSLNRWCEENGLSFATVQRHLDRGNPVIPKNAHKISRATGGAVSVLELLDPEK